MRRGLTTQRLLALFAAGALLLNFPLLRLWDQDAVLFGLPLLPAGLFGIWALLIGLLAVLMERDRDADADADAPADAAADAHAGADDRVRRRPD
jgi:hypothetical protein